MLPPLQILSEFNSEMMKIGLLLPQLSNNKSGLLLLRQGVRTVHNRLHLRSRNVISYCHASLPLTASYITFRYSATC